MYERNYLLGALAQSRSRQSWNDRLEHWEKPASDSEEAVIERAASMVRNVMAQNLWFTSERVRIIAQGSYHNNTNVRQEADMDLRAVHDSIRVEYAPGVIQEYADAALAYSGVGRTGFQIAEDMREAIVGQLTAKFGANHVDATGNKAIRLKAIAGSRADVDLVPCTVLHHVVWNPVNNRYETIEGVAIFGRNGSITFNYPDQHNANGIAKRARTQLRFKKNVRMLKRLRDELVGTSVLEKGEVPSFLIECLVYRVEDEHFLVESDDRYDRLRRIVLRMNAQLNAPAWTSAAREINDTKLLFGLHQPWTVDTATRFVTAAWSRLAA